MNERRWTATWYEGGYAREYIFSAPDSRGVARLDFQLKLLAQGRPIPEQFALVEGRKMVPSLNDFIKKEETSCKK